jgi:hypothetical protein
MYMNSGWKVFDPFYKYLKIMKIIIIHKFNQYLSYIWRMFFHDTRIIQISEDYRFKILSKYDELHYRFKPVIENLI